jgi:hypothetical protein
MGRNIVWMTSLSILFMGISESMALKLLYFEIALVFEMYPIGCPE